MSTAPTHQHAFFDDYSEGAHPDILRRLSETNLNQEIGYGEDRLSARAADLLRNAMAQPNADIHFVTGGTQANLIALAAILKPYESVIAAASGHIAVHEAGAIEATGHRINQVESEDGKVTPQRVQAVVDAHTDEHMVKPRAVYISNVTELGTVYRAAELDALSAVCKANGLLLYLDGARLGSALTSPVGDLDLPGLARRVDLFYIGGTKNGALLGEALVIANPRLREGFRYHVKQRGALLAKGRVVGAQFATLFEDDLFFRLARHANTQAQRLAEGIQARGFGLLAQPQSNLIFAIFPDAVIAGLRRRFAFHTWARVGTDRSSVRLATSWATPAERVDDFLNHLETLL